MARKNKLSSKNNNSEKSYTIGELASICQVTPTTIYRWVISKKIPSFQTMGRHHRVWESDAFTLFSSLDIPHSQFRAKSIILKVLIVDDKPSIRRLIRRLIQSKFPKALIIEAVDGYEAGFKTRDEKPQLVILDLNLPKIDGVKVCQMIKESKDLLQTKVLAVTGVAPERSQKMVLKAGADAFLAKPFDNEDFISKVQMLLVDFLN
ncbi:MAG: response regulator [Elusimicrobiota bacterium]